MRRARVWAAGVVALVLVGAGAAVASDNEKKNDVILHDRYPVTGAAPDYIEVFKKEGNGHKNYLYTVTQVRTSGGMYCTVITVAAESAVSATCLASVPNPEAFIPLDPGAHPDVVPR